MSKMSKLDSNKKFYLMMLLLSATAFLYLSIKIYDNIQAASWHTIEGHVISSKIVPLKKSTNYIFTIQYEYYVDGTKYINDEFSIMNEGISNKQALDLSEIYQDNAPVIIYYDSGNPENSLVKTELSRILVLIWSIALGLMLLSLFNGGIRKRGKCSRPL